MRQPSVNVAKGKNTSRNDFEEGLRMGEEFEKENQSLQIQGCHLFLLMYDAA